MGQAEIQERWIKVCIVYFELHCKNIRLGIGVTLKKLIVVYDENSSITILFVIIHISTSFIFF